MNEQALHKLSGWLYKQGYPDRPVQWSISPTGPGKVAGDAWLPFGHFELPLIQDNVNSLPSGKRLSFRLVDGKTICHATFVQTEEQCRDKALIPPDIARLKLELEEERIAISRDRDEIAKRWKEVVEFEKTVRDNQVDLMKSTVLSIKVSRELDDRTGVIAGNLKEWEEHVRNQEEDSVNHLDELLERDTKINELSEKANMAASLNLLINKLGNAFILNKVKKFEDIPASEIEKYQQYLKDSQDKQYFIDYPPAVTDLGNRFNNLTVEMKADFCKGSIKWAIKNNPGLIREMAAECQQEEMEARESSEES